jgi:hypothetical protein
MLIKIIGIILVLSPLILVSFMVIKISGFKAFLYVWGVTLLLLGMIIIGCFLLGLYKL